MKRLFLFPILCLMPAAQAMDYVKCEAMNEPQSGSEAAWKKHYGRYRQSAIRQSLMLAITSERLSAIHQR